jgi:plastocyanin
LVHRRIAGAVSLACLILIAALLVPAIADASNRRISIANYMWSEPEVHVDLGEHVTWYWTGPDTMHSITGTSPNAKEWDSDPGTLPRHNVGDDYQVTFDKPGTYTFQCKIHSLVRGEIVVSDTPGDPASEPDPVPKNNVDLKKPKLRDAQIAPKFGPRGAPLRYSMSEKAKLDVEYYRFKKGKKKYAGYAVYDATVGYNRARIGVRKPHFKPKSGRYVIVIRATDQSNNVSKAQRLRFRIW